MGRVINKYGLSRHIPADVTRAVRQRCGFGCVMCGNAFYEYEHMIPEFKDAKQHDPDCITLLCRDCHGKVTTGFISKSIVIHANENPYCKTKGVPETVLSSLTESPEILFSGTTIKNCKSIIQINETSILSIKEPEEDSIVYRLSGLFCDQDGNISLEIKDNQFILHNAHHWDAELNKKCLVIKQHDMQASLKLRFEIPNRLIVEKIDMSYQGTVLKGDGASLKLNNSIEIRGNYISGCQCGISLKRRNNNLIPRANRILL